MKSDAELLKDYADRDSAEAFTEIVRRNFRFVYFCVLRRVGGDSHLAEDITQKVFSDMARKAPVLTKLRSIPGWLYVSANLASAEVVRKERRRKVREIEATRTEGSLTPEVTETWEDWTRVRNLLDDLICGLKPNERDAVVLRFFSKKTYLEIGAELSTTEDGARKRVERSLEKLRLKLEKSGVTSSMEILEAVLDKQPDDQPPHKVADRVAGIALVEFGTTGGRTSWLLSLVRLLTSNKAATCMLSLATALLVGWQHQKNVHLEAALVRLNRQGEVVRDLERDNRQLSHSVLEADELRRALTNIPIASSLPRPGPAGGLKTSAPLNVNVTADARIRWENDPVTLEEFLNRLVASRAQDLSSEAPLIVNGEPGSEFSATAYVVEQASKAGFHNIVVNSLSSPSTTDAWVTAPSGPIAAGGNAPPMLPDVTNNP